MRVMEAKIRAKAKGDAGLAIGFAIAFILTYFHWVGLIVGGLVAAFTRDSLKKSMMAGFVFGLVVWVLFLAYMAFNGLMQKYTAMGIVFYLSIAIPIVIPTLSASIRGFWE
jgi:hypothetical protein